MGDLGGMFDFGSSESTTVTKPTRESILSDEQMSLLKKLMTQASYGVGKPAEAMPFSTNIPLTESEKLYGRDVESMRNLGTKDFAGPGYLQALNKVLMGETDQDILGMWEKEVRPMREAEYYGEGGAIPRLKESLVGSGFRSSDTMNSLEKAYMDVGRQMGEEKFTYYQTEKEAARARQAAAAGPTAEYIHKAIMSQGDQERAVEEGKVMENMQRWLGGEMVDGKFNRYANPAYDLALSLMFPTYAIGSETQGKSEGAGQGGQVSGAFMQMSASAASAASAAA